MVCTVIGFPNGYNTLEVGDSVKCKRQDLFGKGEQFSPISTPFVYMCFYYYYSCYWFDIPKKA